MKVRFSAILFALIFGLISCEPDEVQNFSLSDEELIVGTWEWNSGSRSLSPAGFESKHRDRVETYLVGDRDYNWVFDDTGSFTSTLSGTPAVGSSLIAGTWSLNSGMLNIVVSQPSNYQGITQYQVPLLDQANLDLQWSVQYLEFSDAQIDDWVANGIIDPDSGWTVDRDSMLTNFGTMVTAEITLHFDKAP